MWWLLLACTKGAEDTQTDVVGPGDSSEVTVDSDGPQDDSAVEVERSWLVTPPEAEDLDGAEDVVHVELTAAVHTHEVGGETVEGYAFSGSTPGPTIRGRVGDTLIVELDNQLDENTTIHWHGLEVPYEMDGVTWQADPVAPGESFTYTFELVEAGTYWYHPHFDSNEQVSRGLYGLLIVEDPKDPEPAEELLLVFDDWLLGEFDDEGVHGEHGQEGTWTINGVVSPRWEAPAGVTRVRMLNASNTGYLKLAWPELRMLGTERGIGGAVSTPDAIVLGPGDRAEAEWLGGGFTVEDQAYSLHGGEAYGEPVELLVVEGEAVEHGLDWPVHGEAPTPDPGRTDIVYSFSGDTDAGEWFINGEQFPEITIEELSLGDEVVIEVRNLSPTRHPFHLHGLTFEVLSVDGVVPELRSRQDTIDVGVHEAVRLLVTANNPGDWMTHCHILPHAEQGMMTVLRVNE